MFNETLIREDNANTMTVPPNVMYQDSFVKLEREARSKKKGLWADNK
ncbi:thermonuclease family protein [Paenibacillus elgii]